MAKHRLVHNPNLNPVWDWDWAVLEQIKEPALDLAVPIRIGEDKQRTSCVNLCHISSNAVHDKVTHTV